MESAILGIVLDSSVLIAAERRNLTAAEAIESVHRIVGESVIVLSAITIAEIGHGIYRASTPEVRERRRAFLDDLKATVPIHPLTEETGESSPALEVSKQPKARFKLTGSFTRPIIG